MKIRKLIGILVVAVTLPATAMAWGDDWAAEADANADGYSDGLVTEGRGGVMTAGGSAALARADTSPAYATGYAADERGILMGSAGRNGASGDFLVLAWVGGVVFVAMSLGGAVLLGTWASEGFALPADEAELEQWFEELEDAG